MPYRQIDDLPDTVRHLLPAQAQGIDKEAFNRAVLLINGIKRNRYSTYKN